VLEYKQIERMTMMTMAALERKELAELELEVELELE
jgi:hypothetical protein